MICTQTLLAADVYPLLEQTSNHERRAKDLQIAPRVAALLP